MNHLETLLTLLKTALDYLEEETGIEASEVSAVEIEHGFGDVWGVELWTPAGHCIAFINKLYRGNGNYEVYHLHWYDICAACGEAAQQSCAGCGWMFCVECYGVHYRDNAHALAEVTIAAHAAEGF